MQEALGTPLNFTYDSNIVTSNFGLNSNTPTQGTGDSFRTGIADFEYALNEGMKVAMIYGDRDYRCGW